MDLKYNTIPEIAEIRHDDYLGKPYDEIDDHIQRGFVVGYQQAIKDICETMNIDIDDILKNLTKL